MGKPYEYDVVQAELDQMIIRRDRIYKSAKETIERQLIKFLQTKHNEVRNVTRSNIQNAIGNISHKFGYKYSNKLLRECGLDKLGWKLYHPIKELEEL